MIIDDLIKNAEEAIVSNVLEKALGLVHLNTMLSRLEEGGKKTIVYYDQMA